jgi:DNA-binding MarR family transcriptional regulator
MASNNFEASGAGPAGARFDVAAAERALERLFRLAMGRRVHTRQSAAVGAVVTRAGYAILRSLDEEEELTMGELAQRAAIDPAAAGRQVKVLERDGFVARSVASGDARSTLVRLTEAGRDVFHRIVAVRTSHMDQVLAAWPEADRRDLARLVDRLADDLRAVPFRPSGP